MDIEEFIPKARRLVLTYCQTMLGYHELKPDGVYVVWFCKTLQNWKALLSTTIEDDMYYEVTYDGDRNRAYVDAYKKIDNVSVADKESIAEEAGGDDRELARDG
jgi:Family of unknown function (DUF6275)